MQVTDLSENDFSVKVLQEVISSLKVSQTEQASEHVMQVATSQVKSYYHEIGEMSRWRWRVRGFGLSEKRDKKVH